MKNGPFKMKGKSPMMKALIGKQGNLPQELKAKILASPATMKKSPTKGFYDNIKAGVLAAGKGAKYGLGAAYRYGKKGYQASKEKDKKKKKEGTKNS